jgi:uncharacterized damage-inducible protein DinB
MTQTRTDMFRRWFEYERDSHALVLAALNAVPAARRGAPEFRKAATLLAHIIEARRLWLHRMGVAREGPTLDELMPDVVDLAGLPGRLDAMHGAWALHLASLDDEAIMHHFEYRSFEDQPFRNTVVDILTQLYGHSLYHRGQIALLLRAMGAEPATTDFLFWTRESLGSPGA